MISINRMMAIVLGLLFAVVISSFVFSMAGSAEEGATGTLQINNTQQMTQLIFYDSLIGYQCTPERGGYEIAYSTAVGSYWSSWQDYKDEPAIDWNPLEEAGSDLRCYGSTSKLPLSQGLVDPFDDTWLNDQAGEYSRKRFTIIEADESDPVKLGPCHIWDKGNDDKGDPQNAIFFVSSGESPNSVTNYAGGGWPNNKGPGYSWNYDLSVTNCERLAGSGFDPGSGVAVMVNVIDETSSGFSSVNSYSENWDNGVDPVDWSATINGFTAREYELCEGTSGFIQTNVGRNSDEVSRGSDYTQDDPPGESEREVGNDRDSNTIHPYIVITNWEDC